jgi:phosphatidylglycerophosphate synthase
MIGKPPALTRPLRRRPLRSRKAVPIRALAAWLAERRISPNTISVIGLLCALGGAGCLLIVSHRSTSIQIVLLLCAAILIPLRLLANVLDGLVAVEGGLKSAMGDLFNEIPDRIADVALLVAAGYAVPGSRWAPALGWAAALLAVLTAYIRVLGGALGLPQSFAGPMAKPQRMLTLVLAILLSVLETLIFGYQGRVLTVALVIICLGSLLTVARRVVMVGKELV